MKKNQTVHILGYASGIAAGDPGCGGGPIVLQHSPYLQKLQQEGITVQWENMFKPNDTYSHKLSEVAALCEHLATHIAALVHDKKFFLTLGGDHTAAIGTWSGAQHAIQTQGELGLIWIDAHMDSHTLETSQSGNIHGMPVACLLGHGSKLLTHILNASPKLKPEHICLIGVRSFEKEELEFLKKLNVRVIMMDEVKQRGLSAALQEALTIVNTGTVKYGITIDVDSMDPHDAPGTGVQEPDGLLSHDLCAVLQQFIAHDPRLIGAEIVEFDPHHDQSHKTEKIISQLIASIVSGNSIND